MDLKLRQGQEDCVTVTLRVIHFWMAIMFFRKLEPELTVPVPLVLIQFLVNQLMRSLQRLFFLLTIKEGIFFNLLSTRTDYFPISHSIHHFPELGVNRL